MATTHVLLAIFLLIVEIKVASAVDPTCDPVSQSNNVSSTLAKDAVIVDLRCTDADIGDTLVYKIRSGNEDGFFKVENGTLKLAKAVTPKIAYRYLVTIDVGNATTGQTATAISVDIVYENKFAPQISVGSTTIQVEESKGIGTLLAIFNVTDEDSSDTLAGQARIIINKPFGAAARKWVLDGVSGEFFVNTLLDYESTKSYNVTLVAYDLDPHNPRTSTLMITVNVIDSNDNIPVCSEYLLVAPILQNKSIGEEITRINCSDVDSGPNGVIAYALDESNEASISNGFVVDSTTGSLTLKAAITSDTIPFYEVVVQVIDGGNPGLSTKVLIRVVVTDVPQNVLQPASNFKDIQSADPSRSMQIDTSTRQPIHSYTGVPGIPYCVHYGVNLVLSEFTDIQSAVYDLKCQDPDGDTLSYDLSKGDTYDKFAVSNGVLTTVKGLNGDFTFKYSLAVTVKDDSASQLSTTVFIAVFITNSNDNAPVIKDVPSVIEVNEDATYGTLINTCSVNDKDSKHGELPGQTRVGINKLDGTEENRFLLDPVACKLYVNTELDFETTKNYQLKLMAWDLDENVPRTVSTLINITIMDVNDNAPSCPYTPTLMIPENSAIGTSVANISCTDADSGVNMLIYFAIDESNTDAVKSTFTVKPSGEVVLLGMLDYESDKSHNVKVKVYDGGSPSMTFTSTVKVTVMDVSDGTAVQNTSTPTYTTKPTIGVTIVDRGTNVAGYKFTCNFPKSSTPLYYIVDWFIDGRRLHTTKRAPSTGDVAEETALNEETLTSELLITSVGFEISCAFRTSYGPTSIISRDPIISDSQFIGIKVLTKSIDLIQGEEGVIRIQAFSPIGCHSSISCVYPLYSYLQQKGYDCSMSASGDSPCGTVIPARTENKIYDIKVKAGITYQYGKGSSTSILKLRGPDYDNHPLWSNYMLDDVQITIHQNTSLIEGSKCAAFVDPRIVTFDRSLLDLQQLGTFTLYQNDEQEIQIQTYRCDSDRSAFCVCGVAIRAGKDVYIMNKCDLLFHDIRFSSCSDADGEVLKVEKYETLYQAYLPTGTRVKVFMRPDNMNVFIYPSVLDVRKSRGLCGYLSGNYKDDLVLKDGRNSSDPVKKSTYEDAPEFFSSWKVTDNENLFDSNNLASLTSYPGGGFAFNKDNYRCVSSGSQLSMGTGAISNEACNIFTDVSGVVFKEAYTPVTRNNCTSTGNKRRRKRQSSINTPQENTEGVTLSRRKRSDDWKNGWDHEKALEYCDELFNSSSMVSLCKDLSLVDVHSSKIACYSDIKLTGTEKFSLDAMSSVRSQCVHEVISNTDFHKPSTPGAPPVYDSVIAVTCPGECSGRGRCVRGICVCNSSFGGVDCSVNITSEPLLVTLGNDGLCDLSKNSCTEITAFGETFVETSSTSCSVQYYKRKEGQSVDEVEITASDSHRPTLVSISEAKCKTPADKTPQSQLDLDEFVSGYIVSLTNDGKAYSKATHMTVFNSQCQVCNITTTGTTCSFNKVACIGRGDCYSNGEKYRHNNCYTCLVNSLKAEWVLDKDCDGNTRDNGWIVGAVIAVLTSIAIVIGIVVFIKRKNKISASRTELIRKHKIPAETVKYPISLSNGV